MSAPEKDLPVEPARPSKAQERPIVAQRDQRGMSPGMLASLNGLEDYP